MNTPVWGTPRVPRLRNRQGGFAYMLALIVMMTMIAATGVILEQGATQARRNREAEMIWRGNQYKRAIRLYYHKTGKYPQRIDDLTKGLPQLHFLRQEYKDPTNKNDGSWRFIYVNAAGSIIGSTKYATLQQMMLMDQNGGVLPAIPGQPGVSAASLATGPQPGDINTGSTPGTGQQQNQTGQSGSQPNGQNPDGSTPTPGSGDPNAPQNPAGAAGSNLGGDPSNPQNPSQNPQSGSPNPQSPNGSNPTSGMFGPALGGATNGATGIGTATAGNTQVNLAALAMLKPTGPVDGPVLGGFLSGVAGKTDAVSVKRYHGAKKLNQFEFIWNPLEDAAAAVQNQLSNMQGNVMGSGANGSASSGSSPFGTNPTQPQSNSPQPQQTPPSNPQQ